MPHTENILSPFTIIGNGRSGTSLVSRLLSRHSQCSFAGETVNLIHSVWRSMESSLGVAKCAEIPDAIRLNFLKFFPNKSRYWMHKPIGIPIIWRLFGDEEEFYPWFWDVLDAVFPDARYFTVLRHPLDVISSSHRWWGWSIESIVHSNQMVARLITHEKSKVDYAVDFRELVNDPEQQSKKLFDYLGLPFESECLSAFDTAHVMSDASDRADGKSGEGAQSAASTDDRQDDLPERRRDSFSHVDAWKQIDKKQLTPAYRAAVEECWQKFGHDFGGWKMNTTNPAAKNKVNRRVEGANMKAFEKLPEYARKRALNRFVVNQRHRLIYCPIEKNSCTYFKLLLVQNSEHADEFKESGIKVHSFLNQRKAMRLESIEQLGDESYLRFVILREPIGRIVSAYLNKFVRNRAAPMALMAVKHYNRLFGGSFDDDRMLTFEEFVELLGVLPNPDLDVHWRPQSTFAGEFMNLFDWIVPMEGIGEFVDTLEKRMQVGLSRRPTHNKTAYQDCELESGMEKRTAAELREMQIYPDKNSLVTPRLHDLLRKRYKRDFVLYDKACKQFDKMTSTAEPSQSVC